MAASDLTDLKPLYLIYGPEELLLERAVKRLRDRLSAVADLDFNMETFQGGSASADAIVNAANTLPFMSDRRLVIVRDTDKLPAEDIEKLVEYARDPSPSTCLVLVATKIAKNTRLYKAVAAVGTAFEYQAPKRSEYGSHVVVMLRERGKRIGMPAAEELVRVAGRDLRRLESEADKLAAYAMGAAEVTVDDVRAVASASPTTTVFEFLDAVGCRDTAGALRLLRSLLDDGQTVMAIHGMLARHVRALIGARSFTDRRLPPQDAASELGMAPWQAQKALAQAAGFTPERLASALIGLAEAEEQMKTSPADAGLVIQRWVVVVTQGAG